MSDRIKIWLYALGSLVVFGLVAYLAFNLLIFLIPILIVIYIVFKIKSYLEGKKRTNSTINSKTQHKASYDSRIENIDNSNGEVIDVDYEDVNK